MDNGITNIQTLEYTNSILGETKELTAIVAPGQELKRFCPVSLTTESQIKKYDPKAIDETLHIIYGILAEDVKTTTGTAKVLIYVRGEFDVKAVSDAYGEEMEAKGYNYGNIILRKVRQ